MLCNSSSRLFVVRLLLQGSSSWMFVGVLNTPLPLLLFKYTAWEVSQYGVSSGPYFTVLGLKTKIYSVNLRTQFEYGKTIQRNHTSYVLLSDTDTIKLSSCDENPTATISVSLLYVWSKVLLCKENIQKQKFVKKVWWSSSLKDTTQPAFTCSKLTIETLEQGVKYVQS